MMNVFEFCGAIGIDALPHQEAVLGKLYGLPHKYSLDDASQAASMLIPFTQPPLENSIAALMSRRMGATYLAALTALYEVYRLQSFDRSDIMPGDVLNVVLLTHRDSADKVVQLIETLAARANMPFKAKASHDAKKRTTNAHLVFGDATLMVLGILGKPVGCKGPNTASLIMDGILPHAKLMWEQLVPAMAMFRNPDGTPWGKFLVTDTAPELDRATLAFMEEAGLHTYILGYAE